MNPIILSTLLTLSSPSTADQGLERAAEAELLAALDQKVNRTNAIRQTPEAADETVAPSPTELYKLGGGALLIALVAIGASIVLKKRQSGLSAAHGDDLAVRDSVWIGKGQRLLLVGVGGQSVLVGATPQGLFGLGNFARDLRREPLTAKDAPLPAVESAEEDEDDDAIFAAMVRNEIAAGSRNSRTQRKNSLSRLQAL